MSGTPTLNSFISLAYIGTTAVTTGAEVPSGGTIQSLTVSKTGGVTLGTNVQTNNTASVSAGGLFKTGAFTYTNNTSFTNSGTVTVDAGGTFAQSAAVTNSGTFNVNGSYQINASGIVPSGNAFVYGASSTLIFNNPSGAYFVTSSDIAWPSSNGPPNVNVQGAGGIFMNVGATRTVSGLFQYAAGVSGADKLTLNGTAQVYTGGSMTGSPTYGSSSLLQYNTGGAYARNNEWSPGATSGAGYPANVQLSNNTTLDLPNGSTGSTFQLAGNLTVDAGAALSMGALTQALTVVGNTTNNGACNLSSASGGNLNVRGSLTNTGTYTNNSRTLTFNGAAAQTWSDSNSQNFGAVTINNTSGGVSLSSAISVSTLTLTSGKVTTTASNLLTVTNTTAGAVSGGSATSYINGPLARLLPASLASGSIYTYPVGKSGFNLFELVNPTTTAGGTVTLRAEEFDGNSGGTPGTGLSAINTDRYWQGQITSGAGNFTNTSVRLTNSSALAATNAIGKSATQTGAYDSIGGTVVGSTILSNTFSSFSFFAIGTVGNVAVTATAGTVGPTYYSTLGRRSLLSTTVCIKVRLR